MLSIEQLKARQEALAHAVVSTKDAAQHRRLIAGLSAVNEALQRCQVTSSSDLRGTGQSIIKRSCKP